MQNTETPKNILYRFAFSKITVITLFAIVCACLILSLANDLFAFVKPSNTVSFEVTEPTALKGLSSQLQTSGVIDNSLAFWAYVKLKNKDELLESFRGSVELNSDMSYRDILNEFINFQNQ